MSASNSMIDTDSGYYTCNDGGSSNSSAPSRSSARTPSIKSHHSSVSTEIRRNSAVPSRVSITSSRSSKRPSSKSASLHGIKSHCSASSSSSRKSHQSSEPEVGAARQAVPAAAHPVQIHAHDPTDPEQHVHHHEERTPSVHVRSSPDFSSSSSLSNRKPSVSSYTSYTTSQPAYQLKAYSKVPASLPISYKQEGRKYHEHRHHVLRSTSIESIFEAS